MSDTVTTDWSEVVVGQAVCFLADPEQLLFVADVEKRVLIDMYGNVVPLTGDRFFEYPIAWLKGYRKNVFALVRNICYYEKLRNTIVNTPMVMGYAATTAMTKLVIDKLTELHKSYLKLTAVEFPWNLFRARM